MMRYLKVIWLHSEPTEPVLLYSEVGDDNYETRKVDCFQDGRLEHAGASQRGMGTTFLGQAETPCIEEIASADEFVPYAITASEFEAVWRQATTTTAKITTSRGVNAPRPWQMTMGKFRRTTENVPDDAVLVLTNPPNEDGLVTLGNVAVDEYSGGPVLKLRNSLHLSKG